MKYRALIFDFDGTLVIPQHDGLPNKRVINALREASKYVQIGIATGRPLFFISKALNLLPLTLPCILNGGAQIYDPVNRKVIHEYPISKKDLTILLEKIAYLKYKFYLNDGNKDYLITNSLPNVDLFSGAFLNIDGLQAEKILKLNNELPNIIFHKVPTSKNNNYDITINHVSATKQTGINTVIEKTGIKQNEIIAVGDSYNDFPLLMASGLKIAMGNAFDDLKEIADYIAPSVYEDGAVDVINKYICRVN